MVPFLRAGHIFYTCARIVNYRGVTLERSSWHTVKTIPIHSHMLHKSVCQSKQSIHTVKESCQPMSTTLHVH